MKMVLLILLKILLLLILSARATQLDPAADQLPWYKLQSSCPASILTTSAGAPVRKSEANNSSDEISLINNEYFIDTATHFVTARIPGRVVHAKGAGAYGYFEVTGNITHICKAKLFSSLGKRTLVAVRFSLALNEKGLSDTVRGTRGFAVKFYTEEGNFDIIAMSTPMFSFNDPLLFLPTLHKGNRNPNTNLYDANAFWDYANLNPETMFLTLYNFGDHGIPYSLRHLPGYSIHTYQVVNGSGVSYFVRFHFIPDLGIKNMLTDEAKKIGNRDPDSFMRDLYNSIEQAEFPSWTVYLQILSIEDVKNAAFNVFDISRILPEDIYPLTPVGRFVLNKNVLNNFAELEQIAFCPSNLIPGILGAPDKVFETRRLSYRTAQSYRLGANFNKIPINYPVGINISTYLKDGDAPDSNGKNSRYYYTNSFCGLVAQDDTIEPQLLKIKESKSYNFDQATKLINDMSAEEQNRLVENVVSSLKEANSCLQDRTIKLITKIHANVGRNIADAIYATRNR